MRHVIHTLFKDGSWVNELCGIRVGTLFDVQSAAVSAARIAALTCELDHEIHHPDGAVAEALPYCSRSEGDRRATVALLRSG